ncbi:phosphotransferase family protein [Alkalihalobacillus sp. AL-G]|uniref:phosphotransferase family protein n=1 Tax=Alkalihalobacillus sp. AL-G TaxID=2926399 RepID=UPI00272C2F7A|nr:aminoglycoside phosphotransferase family protein [Alkalihalobacillus sp. AL-G]WLD94614.1 aminoglycoside phosphotransferase family protein [Alkalihalobacillus sp. AL-G]
MKQKINHLLELVRTESESICRITSINPYAYGVENCVFKVTTEEWNEVVIRVPWNRFSSNETDGDIDSRRGLEKEVSLTEHCFHKGIPVPEIFYVQFGEKTDFIIQEFIEGDDRGASIEEVGVLVHKLHNMALPPEHVNLTRDINHDLSRRIIERTEAFERFSGQHFPLPEQLELQSILNSYPSKSRLLHMDIRLENLIFCNRRIKAIFDWTNALIGDPVLELMRIQDYRLLNDDFIKGYPNFETEMKRVPDIVTWLYQYDTAVMLTLLFYTELDDKQQGEQAKNRLTTLYEKIKAEI